MLQGGVVINILELEGQVSHAHGLKQGRSRDERFSIAKRQEVQLHTPKERKPQTPLWEGQLALL